MRNTLPLLVILAVGVAFADYESGSRAFWAGDYATALREWLPLAERGDALSQCSVARVLLMGVAPDYQEAIKWYERAADQGYEGAQNDLGILYLTGRGVAKDLVQAYKWLQLAGPGVEKAVADARDQLTRQLTPAQFSEAMAQVQGWRARHNTVGANALDQQKGGPTPPSPASGVPAAVSQGTVVGSARVVCTGHEESCEPPGLRLLARLSIRQTPPSPILKLNCPSWHATKRAD